MTVSELRDQLKRMDGRRRVMLMTRRVRNGQTDFKKAKIVPFDKLLFASVRSDLRARLVYLP